MLVVDQQLPWNTMDGMQYDIYVIYLGELISYLLVTLPRRLAFVSYRVLPELLTYLPKEEGGTASPWARTHQLLYSTLFHVSYQPSPLALCLFRSGRYVKIPSDSYQRCDCTS